MPLLTGSGELATSVRTKINNLINYVLEYGRFAKDVDAMLASSGFTYSTLSLKSVVAGDLIKTVRGGHVFQVLPVGATNYDHVLPSGVLLKLQPRGDGWFEFDGMAPFKNGTTDNMAKLQTLIANNTTFVSGVGTQGPDIIFGTGSHAFSGHINLKAICKLYGHATGFTNNNQTEFVFPDNSAGIIVHRADTIDALNSNGGNGGNADGSEIVGIRFRSGRGAAFDPTKSGVWLRARGLVRNCSFNSFAGHAVWAGAGSDGNPYLGNCNNFRVDQIFAQFCRGSAFCAEGTDANAGSAYHVDGKNNDRWNIEEWSFLGNNHFGHHSESNLLGSYTSRNLSPLSGCYAEDGVGGTAHWGGIAWGNAITSFNLTYGGNGTTGAAPVLGIEYANGPRALLNYNGGFRGISGTTGASMANANGYAFTATNDANPQAFRAGVWINSGQDFIYRWGEGANNLLQFGSASSTRNFGRSAAVGEHLNIWGMFLGLNNNGRYMTFSDATPTSGNFARGDIIFLNGPSSGGVGQVHCTTGGVAGSTAVFRNAANLASS